MGGQLMFPALQQWLVLGVTLQLRGMQVHQRFRRQQHNVGSTQQGEAKLQLSLQQRAALGVPQLLQVRLGQLTRPAVCQQQRQRQHLSVLLILLPLPLPMLLLLVQVATPHQVLLVQATKATFRQQLASRSRLLRHGPPHGSSSPSSHHASTCHCHTP